MEKLRDKHHVLIKPGMTIKHTQHAQVKEVFEKEGILFAGEMRVSSYHSSALEVVSLTVKPIRSLMLFCPITGEKYPYPSTPEQFRMVYSGRVWYYNPYSGTKRDSRDIESDPCGFGIVQDGLPLIVLQ